MRLCGRAGSDCLRVRGGVLAVPVEICECGRQTWAGRARCQICSRARKQRGRALEEPREAPDTECECGVPKLATEAACPRCALLDGLTTGQAEVIWALRLYQTADWDALEAATGLGRRSLYRAAAALADKGRISQKREPMAARRGGSYRSLLSLT